MKTLFAILLAASIAALAVLSLQQSRKLSRQQAEATVLRTAAEQKAQEVAELQAAKASLDQDRRDLARESDELARQLRARRAAEAQTVAVAPAKAQPPAETGESSGSASDRGGFGKMFGKMMQDPDTKKFIRDQQRLTMDQLYAPLVKQLGFSPEEAGRFKDLLADNMMKGAEKASAMFDVGSSTNHAAVIAAVADEQKGFDAQVKDFLGDSRYSQFKDYQQTVGERTMLNQFKQQTTDSEHPLTDAQTEQLLSLMKEEKQNAAASTGQASAGAGQDQAGLQAMLSQEQSDKLLESQATVNQNVFQRATHILAPDQLEAFGGFQTNQLQMMRMGMNMARKMFAPDKSAPSSPSAN